VRGARSVSIFKRGREVGRRVWKGGGPQICVVTRRVQVDWENINLGAERNRGRILRTLRRGGFNWLEQKSAGGNRKGMAVVGEGQGRAGYFWRGRGGKAHVVRTAERKGGEQQR